MNKQPNVVFLLTDQQRYDTIAALGHPHCITPHLDRLVNEGVSFSQCHVTAPSCAPSRASLFTGQYPHVTGILKNADNWTRSWVENLGDAGYHCVNVGKMHTWPFTTPCGFDERYVVENKDRFLEGAEFTDVWEQELEARGLVKQKRILYRQREDYQSCLGSFLWELPEDTQSDMFVGDRAIRWINEYDGDKPFFLEVGFPGPHPPYDPSPRFLEMYQDRDIPLDPVTQEDLDGQPPPLKGMRTHNAEIDHDSVVHSLDPSEQQRKNQRAHYLANVTMIDQKVGDLMATLEKQGLLENTVIFFSSDHGDCLTDHGHSQKWTMYEQITRVPLLAWSPGRFEAGHQVDDLVQLMDLGPAILELAGAELPDPMGARSLLPAMTGDPDWKGRECVYAEQAKDLIFTDSEFMTMVRTKDWKLVHFMGESFGQLFDLQNDPRETANLWDDAHHAETKQGLLDNLREWRIRSHYETAKWADEWR
jgi:arylsulfatase